ncbi:CAP Gly-rich domain-containing protein, partial [Mycena olivaceomarginata]
FSFLRVGCTPGSALKGCFKGCSKLTFHNEHGCAAGHNCRGSGPPAGRGPGVVRFFGVTSFMGREWIGIEVYEPNGKNDGSVAGVSYFTYMQSRTSGIFVRTSQIKDTFGSEDELQRPPPTARPSFADEPGSRMLDGEDE